MEASASAVSTSMLTAPTLKAVFRNNIAEYPKSTINLRGGPKRNRLIGHRSLRARTPRRRVAAAINDISAATDAVPVELTWQVVVGAVAGVTPFVVAGIEFSKRIVHSTKKMRGVWRVRASSKGVLCAMPRMWWVSTMAVVEEILFWLTYS
ncbi:hypothetical protein FNV43_RR03787 [Rhamnella rubrinervis]|uniref:Uncharacterized protein n=1 Tax=Rhamnella rubrinervis TaxID=2594499 RepID=A0A8K0HID6_9ROSA|nr:hypothetical protein FNV43_RR03787 [Rhamnella rubrinervis]